MKAYQILVPTVLCVLAAILARTEADDELRILNDRLQELTKEYEERLRAEGFGNDQLLFSGEKRGIQKATRGWSPLSGQSGIAFGKRTDDNDRARIQTDQFTKKARLRPMFGHSALSFGKRTQYIPQDIWDMQDATKNLDTFEEIPAKKRMGFTGNTGILFGKRNAEDAQE